MPTVSLGDGDLVPDEYNAVGAFLASHRNRSVCRIANAGRGFSCTLVERVAR